MAMKRTGGEKTDEVLGKNGSGPEGLPHSIIVTPDGIEGEVPAMIVEASATPSANGNGHPAAGAQDAGESKATTKGKATAKAKATARAKAAAKGRGEGTVGRQSAGRTGHGRKTDRRPRSAHATAGSKARARREKG
jgi:DNA topoisomerase-6 subunit B